MVAGEWGGEGGMRAKMEGEGGNCDGRVFLLLGRTNAPRHQVHQLMVEYPCSEYPPDELIPQYNAFSKAGETSLNMN